MMNDMMNEPEQTDPQLPAFAGRDELFQRLQQRLIDPNDRHAQVYSGRDSIGKSAWLQHCLHAFEPVLLGVYIPLGRATLRSEHAWLSLLIQSSYSVLLRHDFSLTRLPEQPAETAMTGEAGAASLRTWLDEVYLPEIWRIIRPQRRLVWLIDDIQVWLDAADAGNLPQDSAAYLHQLMRNHPQLGIVLTLDSDAEERLGPLLPLIQTTDIKRLNRLNREETSALMQHFAPGVSADAVSLIHKSSGGYPKLLQRFGDILSQQPASQLQPEHIRKAIPEIYRSSTDELRSIWQILQRDEKLVLNAISALLYADPLRPVTVELIEVWLVETDYPLDVTAINAALRSMEYHEIIVKQGPHIELVMGLMQSWLLENARLDTERNPDKARMEPGMLAGLLLIVAIVTLMLLFFLQAAESGSTPQDAAVATVTLVSDS